MPSRQPNYCLTLLGPAAEAKRQVPTLKEDPMKHAAAILGTTLALGAEIEVERVRNAEKIVESVK